MVKLQQIKRNNGSRVHSVNIPIGLINELNWQKGDELTAEIRILSGKKIITISKEEC